MQPRTERTDWRSTELDAATAVARTRDADGRLMISMLNSIKDCERKVDMFTDTERDDLAQAQDETAQNWRRVVQEAVSKAFPGADIAMLGRVLAEGGE